MATRTPNILLITWHDAGRWFGCYGYDEVRTPHVDALAAGGTRFARTFSACAICSPSRAALATGRYCQANGVYFLTNTVNNNRLHRDERHLCRRLGADHGYATALCGIQHEAAHEHVTEILAPGERFATDPWPQAPVVAEAACGWLRRRARTGDGRPFYLQVGFHEAHLNTFYFGEAKPAYPRAWDEEGGLHVPPYLVDNEAARRSAGTLQGYLRRGDAAVGRILDELESSRLAEDTIVVMAVDHGVGLARAKAHCYDPGLEVAWIVRGPGVAAGHVVGELCTHVDVLPTVFELAGLPVPPEVQGRSLARHARGDTRAGPVRDAVFSHMVETERTIRTKTHRLVRHFRPHGPLPCPCDQAMMIRGSGVGRPPEGDDAPRVELFDTTADPCCAHDLAGRAELAAVRADLEARLWDFLLEGGDFVVHEPPHTAWQRATRDDLEAHCRSRGRPAPVVDGP